MPEAALPPMPVPMPRLGATMDEGVLIEWLKREGDAVEEHEPLFEVETDKAVVQVESPVGGVLASILAAPGSVVPVGEAVALVAPAGSVVATASAALPPAAAAISAPTGLGSPPPAVAAPRPQAPTANIASQGAGDLAAPFPGATDGPAGATAGPAVRAGPAPVVDGVRLRMTPAARRLMRERGVGEAVLRRLAARGGRITRQALWAEIAGGGEAAAAPRAVGAAPVAPAIAPAPAVASGAAVGPGAERVALTPMRRAIARAMTVSARDIPQFSVTRSVDMGEAVAAVTALRAWSKDAPTVTDFLIHAVAHALARFPALNAHMDGEESVRFDAVRLGLATATDAGLVVPVIAVDADTSLAEIGRRRRYAVAQAQAGRLGAEQATFTLSNLGPFAVDRFVALVNPPEVAILAAGTVAERAVVRDGQVAVRPTVDLTVSADHRATDGAEVARFLQALAEFLADRAAWRLF